MNVQTVFEELKSNEINYFCGVPDSLLKDFCAYVTDNELKNHTICANEGNAIALAAGHYLASGKIALVYMQNSGLGNCVNPLLSLLDEDVYNIPVLMFIGLRGEPNTQDEPQHIKQGKVTDKLLETMGIKYSILSDILQIKNAIEYMKSTKKPYAFLIKKGTFEKYKLKNEKTNSAVITREDAIQKVATRIGDDAIVVSTTGKISRELYEIRNKFKKSHKQDFLTVGSMGHASSIAMGIALEKTNKAVYCFDGDGAAIMHLGAIPVIASKKMGNFKHIIFNNEAHDSVGAQPTCADGIDFVQLAISCGYKKAYSVDSLEKLENIFDDFIDFKGTALLEIKVKIGSREDLGRPKEKPFENKEKFMEFLSE